MHPAITGCLVPSKLYGIMAAGTPVLAMVPPETDFHTLIERENVGFAVSPGDLDTMEACIVRCADGQVDLEAMGLRARELAEAELIGPILLGMKKPVHILPLGSSVRDIVNMAAIAVMDAQTKPQE